MHFNVYMDDQTGQQLNAAAQQQGQTRNTLIRAAVKDWLTRQNQPKWPNEVLDFQGMADMPPFEERREQLKRPVADPLA
jgi:predicted transcriptional regulator